MKTIALFPNHPAQFWVLYALAQALEGKVKILWYMREKDVTCALALRLGMDFKIISQGSQGLLGNGLEHLHNIKTCLKLTRQNKIDLWVTKNPGAHMAAWMTKTQSIAFNNDDIELIPIPAWISFPFAGYLVTPESTRMGRYAEVTKRIKGFFEMFYLHPKRFRPDPAILQKLGLEEGEPYGIIRLVSLTAHHDIGVKGISEEFLRQIIKLNQGRMKLFITSEKPLSEEFEPLRMAIPPEQVHHALYYAQFFLGDSQTMNMEAALLGTPAFRFNSFVGKISVIEEMEKLGLSFGFLPGQEEALLEKLAEVLEHHSKREFQELAVKLYQETPDPLEFFLQLVEIALETKR